MKIATYDIAKNKTAPRGLFVCPYCGKIIERRLSKVKNTSLVLRFRYLFLPVLLKLIKFEIALRFFRIKN